MMDFALVALLATGAFWSGLYAPGQQLLVTALFAVAVLTRARATGISQTESVALVLVTAGVASSMRVPAAAGAAAHGPVVAAGWVLAWAFGRQAAGRDRIYRFVGRAVALVGFLMVFGGAAAMSYLPVNHTGRLASFLGYPIALGVLGLLGLAGSLPPLADRRWWASALAFGNAAAVLLSGSRGVWGVGLLLALYLGWASPQLLRRIWPVLAAALGATLWAGPAVAARHVMPATLPLLLGVLTVLLIDRFPGGRRQRALWVVAGAAWLASVALAPGWPWFLGRAAALSLTEGSSVERMTFLRDGFAIARNLPLGAGFRAWTALELQHASYDYYSAEVHSAPLDLALAFGWAGATGFLLLLGRQVAGLRAGHDWSSERLVVLAGMAALGVHALVDWDLSYGYFAGLLWLGFGLMEPPAAPGKGRTIPFGVTAAVAALALAGTVVLGAGDVFEALSERALAAGAPQTAYRHALMATRVTPWNDLAQAMLGQTLVRLGRPAEARKAFARARALGPYEPWYAELQAQALQADGRPAEAASAYREYVRLWPWQVSAYEEALQAHMDMLLSADIRGDQSLARTLTASGQEILAALDSQVAKQPAHAPRAPMQVDTPVIQRARDEFGPAP